MHLTRKILGEVVTQKDVITRNTISAYPNAVTSNFFTISFSDQYDVQLVDVE